MEFGSVIQLVKKVLEKAGSTIDSEKYDALIVKHMSKSNTLDAGRETTNQSHIAITGKQMDMFPYICSSGYLETEYDKLDKDLKKFYMAQIPAYIHKENISYLDKDAKIITEEEKRVHISVVRTRRKEQSDQLQISMIDSDSPEFVAYRRIVHTGDYFIILKRTKELLYDVYAIKEADAVCPLGSLEIANNGFFKMNTSTIVKLDENLSKSEDDKENTTFEQEMTNKSCLEVKRSPRESGLHPLNIIIYGAPGTGKTYSTVEYALAIIENRAVDKGKKDIAERKTVITKYKDYITKGQVVFTTFHQSYGYEEFIQGLRPDTKSGGIAFKTVDGIFKTIADNALNEEDKNFVIIIDEINRANISKVFGELITLIEEDKRWGEVNETCATLQSGDVFAVPNNLYIVGTMNSADKSISLIDAALRRRFIFIEQTPDDTLIDDPLLRKFLHEMNLLLAKELDSTDLLVGHSYFMNKTADDLCGILNNNIIPLLYEYFYDKRKKVASVLGEVISKTGANIDIEDTVFGRLRVKIKEDGNGSEQV